MAQKPKSERYKRKKNTTTSRSLGVLTAEQAKEYQAQGDGYSDATKDVLGDRTAPMAVDAAVAGANPNYESGSEYRINCQRCVVAVELRLRGYDVEALPQNNSMNEAYRNWNKLFEGQTGERLGLTRKAQVQPAIEQRMNDWGSGARAVVYVAWDGGSAHVFNVVNTGSGVLYIDGQDGSSAGCEKYFNRAKPSLTMIFRVDDKKINEQYIDQVVKKKGT